MSTTNNMLKECVEQCTTKLSPFKKKKLKFLIYLDILPHGLKTGQTVWKHPSFPLEEPKFWK